jgi:SEC-C motif domain protein
MQNLCPCGSNKKYCDCCQSFHDNLKKCRSAKELLLSRYSAYALGKYHYIINTTYETKAKDPIHWSNEIKNAFSGCNFLGIHIYSITEITNHATIHFKAKMRCNNKDESFNETSLFIKKSGIWYYQEPVAGLI